MYPIFADNRPNRNCLIKATGDESCFISVDDHASDRGFVVVEGEHDLIFDYVVNGDFFIVRASCYVPAIFEIDYSGHCCYMRLDFAGDGPRSDVPKN